ncbi:hypothetical protein QI155_10425 [Thermodesulfovibrio sp. 1176]|uniref:hypothetical protein n=1 Tax=Thermodesulfovibrio sp. 1176 TaxID=3043424 RepID=UPI0024829879|nr:hypothetical protein [Thermodesulfovibrio sp. 1176]MDI1472946.1 hypothetical protein [Thermodesulfovibrio sp. 1176]
MFMILDAEKVNVNEELSEIDVECPLCSFVQQIPKEELAYQSVFSCPECNTLFVIKNKNRR